MRQTRYQLTDVNWICFTSCYYIYNYRVQAREATSIMSVHLLLGAALRLNQWPAVPNAETLPNTTELLRQ